MIRKVFDCTNNLPLSLGKQPQTFSASNMCRQTQKPCCTQRLGCSQSTVHLQTASQHAAVNSTKPCKALKQELKNPSRSFPPGHIWECIYFISCEKIPGCKWEAKNEWEKKEGRGKRKKTNLNRECFTCSIKSPAHNESRSSWSNKKDSRKSVVWRSHWRL